jgi:hypothetical protein
MREPGSNPFPPLDRRLLALVTGAKLLLHLALSNRYGYFRDELYFLDCGRHLDWGYVDHAPMIGLLARVALLLGGSLPVLRGLSALAGAAIVGLAMLIAQRLGGGRFAQGLAGLAVLVMPIRLAIDGLFTMNSFEPLFWMGAVLVLLRIVQGGDPRLWLALGAILGLGLMNKHSTAFFAVALAAGIVLTPLRRALRTRWPWLGALVALAIFAPNVLWQWRHGFPTLEDLRNVARTGKNVVLGPAEFFGQQALIAHPVLLPLWVGGLAWLLAAERGRHRVLGWASAIFFALMFAMRGKNYYLAPLYPLLFAAGAVALERGLRDRGSAARWARPVIVALVLTAGATTAPLALALLSPEGYLAYEAWLGFTPPKTEVAHRGPLPQNLGDQFGWPELVAEIARIYHALPPEDRARAGILAGNYGEAGAVNLFGPRYGLPRAISGHQTHFFWGPQGQTGDVLIAVQWSREALNRRCRSVAEAGAHFHPWGMAEENRPLYVCRGFTPSLTEAWPGLKHWN